MKIAVFVDVQNDFIKGGTLAFGYPKRDIVPDIVKFAKDRVDSPDWKLYATRDTHIAGGADNEKWVNLYGVPYLKSLEGMRLPVPHCYEGQPGWNIAEPLMEVLDGHCTFVNKPTFGSLDLAELIEEDSGFNGYAVDEIVLTGFCTSICVAANACILRARFPNTKISVAKDLCGCVSEESHAAALKVLEMQQIDVV